MADKIRIEGVPPYNGEYEFDISTFTMRELHQLKKLTGLRVGELEEAMKAGDTDVIVGLAVLALQRNGVEGVDADLIWDADMGAVSFVSEDADEVPPTVSPSGQTNDAADSSGVGSTTASDSQANDQRSTGTPDSPMSVTSDLATLAT